MLCDRARRAAAGRGSVVLLAGEAGIGKTVLLREFAAQAPVPVLWGMCDSLSTPRPLGPLRDVARELGPEVTDVLREAGVQHEIFAAVLDALQSRACALVVEDLHWGDEATLDLVRFLARRIGTLPLLLVLSYRETGGAAHPLRAVLGDLVGAPDASRLQLTPLSRAAVAELLDGHRLDPVDVHARTAGNPFFVSQIIAQPDSPMPESVRDAVVARTAALTPEQRRALELLSCAPEGVSGTLLAALDVPPATVEALGATGLLDRRGRGVAFRHEIARSAVLGAVPPGAEPALHTRMIEALEAAGGDASVLAHHATAAADVPRILRHAPAAAADAARSGAHREAVAFYELALRHLGDDAPAARAAVLEALAVELYLTDRLDAAIAARTQALELRRALGDVVAVGEGHRALSLFAYYAADRRVSVQQDEAAISILSDAGEPRALGYALANRAYLAAGRGDLATGLQAGHDAQRIGDELADAALQTTASIGVALIRLNGGDPAARSLCSSCGGWRRGWSRPACLPRPRRHSPSRRGSCAGATPGSTGGRYRSTCPAWVVTSCAGGCVGSPRPACSISTPRVPPPRPPCPRSSRTSGPSPCGTAGLPTISRPPCHSWTSWTPAPSRPWCGGGCASSGCRCRAVAHRPRGPTPVGSPTASSTCWPCSSTG